MLFVIEALVSMLGFRICTKPIHLESQYFVEVAQTALILQACYSHVVYLLLEHKYWLLIDWV